MNLAVVILPSGHLALEEGGERVASAVAGRIRKALEQGQGELLLHLASHELQTSLPADLAYLREYAREYLTAACHAMPSGAKQLPDTPVPSAEQLELFAMRCPPVKGGENLTASVLGEWWRWWTSVCVSWRGGLRADCRRCWPSGARRGAR